MPRGFSLFELMIVVVIVGALAALAIPKFSIVRDSNNVGGARARMESTIATARAAAIHKGRLSVFTVSGNWISVRTQNPTTGLMQYQVRPFDLSAVYPGVQIQVGGPGITNIWYEPRGLTWSGAKPTGTLVFRVIGHTKRDSVCVTRQGQLLPRGCAL
ncbi:MAG: type IV pilin protein [Gemmatimonadaceae bacterium]